MSTEPQLDLSQHNAPEYRTPDSMEWEMGRFKNKTKFLFHTRPERPTEPNAGFLHYEPGAGFRLHKHDFAQVWYVIDGQFTMGDGSPGPVAMQLRQALLNLIRNAREAMPAGGTLTLGARPVDGGGVEITIADTGEGMSEEAVRRIFEPFFTTKKSGTGLGLSLTQQIVQQHGGRLECESRPGHGTTFRVLLPG